MIYNKELTEKNMSEADIKMVSGGKAIFFVFGSKVKFLERLYKITAVDEPDLENTLKPTLVEVISKYNKSKFPLLINGKKFRDRMMFLALIKERTAPIIIFTETK